MSRVISLDYETFYDKKTFSVTDLGYWKYARDPRCDPYLVSVCDGTECWAGEPKDFNFASLEGATLLSHNSAFDQEISLGAAERGLFVVPEMKTDGMEHWHCTLNMAAYLWNVRSLKDAAKTGLGIDVDKGVRDRANGKTMADIKREGFWDDMLQYGRHDAQNCWMLWDKHGAKWPEFERNLSQQTIDQGRHGLRIDIAALDQGIAQLQQVIFVALQNLPWIKRGKKPASPIGIAEECKMAGIPPPPVKAHNPEAAQEWEDRYAPLFKFVFALKNIRKAKKTLATLETIKLRIRDDETVAFSLKYAGAHTLRWAGDSGWNLQNMNKEPLLIDSDHSFIFDFKLQRPLVEEFQKEIDGKAAVGVLKNGTSFFDIRGLIIARPGMKLGPVDLAQIEPRVLNYLAGNTELLDMLRQGMAIYEAHARKTMGWTTGELKTLNKALYQLAKIRVLGLGYGCGWEKLITIAAKPDFGCIDLTEGDEQFAIAAAVDHLTHARVKHKDKWIYASAPLGVEVIIDPLAFTHGEEEQRCVFVKTLRKRRGVGMEVLLPFPVYGMRARVTVNEFRASNPLIMELHQLLEAKLRESVGGDLVVEGPHGGKLTYRDVWQERRKKKDKETGETYEKTVYTALIGGFREILYGGLLCENLVQWVARMIFAELQLNLHRKLQAEDSRQRVLFTVHDEAVTEVLDTPGRLKQLEADMSISPAWIPDIPLGAEAHIVTRYCK